MTASHPMVSIGLPVFNGERFLREALDSLLAQTLSDFEIVISDNASTDSTWDICREYAGRDGRICAIRQERNLGAPANWNFVARQAKGRYFKWASASDLCAPTLLERCVQALHDASVVLAFGYTCFIDESGREIGTLGRDFAVEDSKPRDRFRRVCHNLSINNPQNGLIRRDALLRTKLDRLYPHGDLVLMAELAMLGKFVLIDETLLYRRSGGQHFTGTRSAHDLALMFQPAGGRMSLLNLRRHLDFITSALRSPVSARDRIGAAVAALRGLFWDRRGLQEDFSGLMPRHHA